MAEVTGVPGRFTWVLRMDPQVEDAYGSLRYVPDTYGREIDRRFPALLRRVIFMTGDALTPETRAVLEELRAPFLRKPLDLADIGRVVGTVLASQPAPFRARRDENGPSGPFARA